MSAVKIRALSERETAVLQHLLTTDFAGAEALRRQVDIVTVVGRCSCGCPSIDLRVDEGAPRASVLQRVPVQATAYGVPDASGHAEPEGVVMLFVDDGLLSYLEYAPLHDETPSEFPPPARLVGVGAVR